MKTNWKAKKGLKVTTPKSGPSFQAASTMSVVKQLVVSAPSCENATR